MTVARKALSSSAAAAFSNCLSRRRSLTPALTAVSPAVRLSRSLRHLRAGLLTAAAASTSSLTREDVITGDPANNITDSVFSKLGKNLHRQSDHPLCIIKTAIYTYFAELNAVEFRTHDDFSPIVSTEANFDELLIPQDHVSRMPNDTYYVDRETVLRCHTSAHQAERLREQETAFLVTGDVYRRDAIDATHYPVFHQTEGVRVFSEADWSGLDAVQFVEKDLKETLEGLAKYLFGEVDCRWAGEYFPFTDPSFELEIFFKGEWMEVLGCGVMQQAILDKNYGAGHKAWAFGLGLERLAMVLFDIPDIRLFWSADERFRSQFKRGIMSTKFKPFSKYPPVYRDMAFWLSPLFSENNLCELIREIAGDLCEEVKLMDEFTHPKTERTSRCYRITYRANERSLVDEEVNALQLQVRDTVAEKLRVELR